MAGVLHSSTGCHEASVIQFMPGSILERRFEVLGLLGRGASGIVYKCLDRKLGNLPVALKIFSQDTQIKRYRALRLSDELQASFAVDHQNVARFYDFVRSSELLAISMEYVEGQSLRQLLQSERRLGIDEIKYLLRQMCVGLQSIHEKGILHRDLKPENILISKEGTVKITDFGISSKKREKAEKQAQYQNQFSDGAKRVTSLEHVVGTPYYASPEYIQFGIQDVRSEIYALGVIAYELIARKPPFRSDSLENFLYDKLERLPAPPHTLNPECPPELSKMVLEAIRINPADRFPDAASFRRKLDQLRVSSAKIVYQTEKRRKVGFLSSLSRRIFSGIWDTTYELFFGRNIKYLVVLILVGYMFWHG